VTSSRWRGVVERRAAVLELAAAFGSDAFLACDAPTVTWLTGYAPTFSELRNPFAPSPAVLLARGEEPVLVLDERSAETVGGFDGAVRTYAGYGLGSALGTKERWREAVGQAIGRMRPLANEADVPAAFADRVAAAPLDGPLAALRVVKGDDEVERLRCATRVCDAGQQAARAAVAEGATEIDVWSAACAAMDGVAGGPVTVFGTVASGPRSVRGGPPTNRILCDGDLVLVDLAPCVDGYWSDSCATYPVGGPTSEHQEAHTEILDALAAVQRAIAAGVRVADLDRLARHRLRFTHHLGHGIGVSFHESPRVVPDSDEQLSLGSVIALEPAWYTQEWGMRVEQVVVVTGDGHELLSRHCTAL
jgi:Xaa-Pro dipeptidase